MVMVTSIELGKLSVDVVRKDIRNLHLSVYPPTGRVRIAAPLRMNLDTIRLFAISKLGWIRQQQKKLREQEREAPREYVDRESHYLWGRRYLLKVVEANAPVLVEIKHRELLLRVRDAESETEKLTVLDGWYRERMKEAIPALIAKWESLMGVKVRGVLVRKMKTLWGSCSHTRGTSTGDIDGIKQRVTSGTGPITALAAIIGGNQARARSSSGFAGCAPPQAR